MKKKRHQIFNDFGEKLNADVEVHDGELILCSRGGTRGSPTERNPDYNQALLHLLKRIEMSEINIDDIWVDSKRVQNLPLTQRSIFYDSDLELSHAALRTELSRRMATVGRSPISKSRGNPTKRIRFAFTGEKSDARIMQIIIQGDYNEFPTSYEDRIWVEGNRNRKIHLRRERNSRAALEKKEVFREEHGRLYCERCNMVPEEIYGLYGDACIEVHHKIPLSDSESARGTRLEDLMCVCANCHRVLHRKLRELAT